MPTPILDSHVHLVPQSAANAAAHAYMKSDSPLTRQLSVGDYLAASNLLSTGFIYVETDRVLQKSPAPGTNVSDEELTTYAAQPLEEIAFLRRLIEGDGVDEGNLPEHADLCKGLVIWAPLHLGVEVLAHYLKLAENRAGRAWERIRGVRFLLQGMLDEDVFRGVTESEEWLEALVELGRRGLTFDVGVDQRSGGVWQVERMAGMVEEVRKREIAAGGKYRVRFVLNHMCKPDLRGRLAEDSQKEDFIRWETALENMAGHEGVYMKLSGAFSELESQDESNPLSPAQAVDQMQPWLKAILKAFSPARIMFGSDWPVCNIGGPGWSRSWMTWHDVVEAILEQWGATDEQRSRIWHQTAEEAYRLFSV